MIRILWAACLAITILGCRTDGYDRIPATAVDNPDPLMGGSIKPRQDAALAAATTAPPPNSNPGWTPNSPANQAAAAIPTAQRGTANAERIGPLAVPPPAAVASDPPLLSNSGISPGTASLALGVKEPQPMADGNIQPASSFAPAANPEIVQNYRKKLTEAGAMGVRTKQLDATLWEATAHFPATTQANQLRRIEAQGQTEADALLAILEKVTQTGKK